MKGFGHVVAGRGGIYPYEGTTKLEDTFYGFIPHQDMTPTSLTEQGSDTNVVKSGITYKQGHYYAAEKTYYTSITMANADDGIDVVKTIS